MCGSRRLTLSGEWLGVTGVAALPSARLGGFLAEGESMLADDATVMVELMSQRTWATAGWGRRVGSGVGVGVRA